MKTAMAFFLCVGMIGMVFGGARTALMVHTHGPVIAQGPIDDMP